MWYYILKIVKNGSLKRKNIIDCLLITVIPTSIFALPTTVNVSPVASNANITVDYQQQSEVEGNDIIRKANKTKISRGQFEEFDINTVKESKAKKTKGKKDLLGIGISNTRWSRWTSSKIFKQA